MKTLHLLIAAAFILTAAYSGVPVEAKPYEEHVQGNLNLPGDDVDMKVAVTGFNDHERMIIRNYVDEHYKQTCPEGLTWKDKSCLPPDYVKRYIIGQPIATGVTVYKLPADLADQVTPPAGYSIGQLDGDIIMIQNANGVVTDTVTLLAAVR